jgi:hypothetical protein
MSGPHGGCYPRPNRGDEPVGSSSSGEWWGHVWMRVVLRAPRGELSHGRISLLGARGATKRTRVTKAAFRAAGTRARRDPSPGWIHIIRRHSRRLDTSLPRVLELWNDREAPGVPRHHQVVGQVCHGRYVEPRNGGWCWVSSMVPTLGHGWSGPSAFVLAISVDLKGNGIGRRCRAHSVGWPQTAKVEKAALPTTERGVASRERQERKELRNALES